MECNTFHSHTINVRLINAISSVIIVESNYWCHCRCASNIFEKSNIVGFSNNFSSRKYIWGFPSHPKNVADLQEKIVMSANLISIILFDFRYFIYSSFMRPFSSPETSRQGNYFGIAGMAISIIVTFLTVGRNLDQVSVAWKRIFGCRRSYGTFILFDHDCYARTCYRFS